MSAKVKIAAVAGFGSLCGASLFVLATPAGAQDEAEIAEFSAQGDTVQSFTVPDGVTCLNVAAAGAQGGEGGDLTVQIPGATDSGPEGNLQVGGAGTNGALVTTTVAVEPGSVLDVIVGVQGGDGQDATQLPLATAPEGNQGGLGGFADGGDGGASNDASGGGGGGKSEVAPADDDSFLVVAGGGGGGGAGGFLSAGGSGGADAPGGNPAATAGGDGTQSDPGAAGTDGGGFGIAPAGGPPATPGDGSAGGEGSNADAGGGGGGGGFFGGGGGGGGFGAGGAGGGAGSSFSSETAEIADSSQSGDGSVLLSWVAGDDSCVQGTGVEQPPAAQPEAVTPTFTG